MSEVLSMSKDGSEHGTVSLNGPLFESEPDEHILQEYIKAYMRNQRQGTSSTLNRARMKGGGKKPFRQKGTGRARAGSNISPLWTGGAVVWGPSPRNHYARMPRALKKKALRAAFSFSVKDNQVRVVELPELNEPKTKVMADYLKNLGLYQQKTLLLYEGRNDNLTMASRNIEYFNVKRADQVNPFDLLWHKNILITGSGLKRLQEVFGDAE
jgi:large subunit ribosomal protein L4